MQRPPCLGGRCRSSVTGFPNAKSARTALAKVVTDVDAGTYTEPLKVPVRTAVEDYLASVKPTGKGGRGHRGKLGIATWEGYRTYLNAYVVPEWGGRLIRDVTGADIERLYDRLELQGGRDGEGLKAKSLANLHGVLSRLFKWGLSQDPPLLAKNPLAHVSAPRPKKSETDIWTAEQLGRFLAHVSSNGEEYAAYDYLLATTGMRRGEIAGLSWDDIDLDAGEGTIRWTLGLFEAQPVWKEGAKSEAGDRTMSLDPATVAVLKKHKARQLEHRLAFGEGWQETYTDALGTTRGNLVFRWPDGSVINPERWSDWFERYCTAAGLPVIRLHDVRHSYATIAASQADSFADIIVLSRRLGHKSVAMTLDRYGHALPKQDLAMAKGIAELIVGA